MKHDHKIHFKMKIKKFLMVLAFIGFLVFGFNSFAQKKIKAEYQIENKTVGQKEFETFLSSLKELEHTWFCAETSTGGRTGYDAQDKNGIVYEYRAITENKKSRSMI